MSNRIENRTRSRILSQELVLNTLKMRSLNLNSFFNPESGVGDDTLLLPQIIYAGVLLCAMNSLQ